MGRGRPALTGAPSAAARGLVAAVPLLFLAGLVAWPLVAVFQRSLVDTGLSDVGRILARGPVLRVVWFTIWQAGLSAGSTLVLGLPIAHVVARYRFPGRAALRALVVVPFVLPTVVVAAAVGSAFDRLGLGFDRSLGAVLAAHVFFNLAVVVRVVGGYWAGLDRRQVEAAMILGASPARAWWTVTARQLAPVLTGSFLLVFLFSFTSFGVIRILGGLRRATIETEIHRYAIARQEFDVAAVLAGLQIAVVLGLAVATARFQRRHGTARRRSSAPVPVVGLVRWLHLGAVVALVVVVVGGPVAVLVEQSLRVGGGHGLDHYRALGERVDLLPLSALAALANSVVFAAGAAASASVVGICAAVVIVRGGVVGRALEAVALLPLGVSAVTLGFGYLVGLTVFDLRRSVWLVPLAHAVIGLPFVLAAVVPALRSIDPAGPGGGGHPRGVAGGRAADGRLAAGPPGPGHGGGVRRRGEHGGVRGHVVPRPGGGVVHRPAGHLPIAVQPRTGPAGPGPGPQRRRRAGGRRRRRGDRVAPGHRGVRPVTGAGPAPGPGAPTGLVVDRATVRYGDAVALDDVSLEVEPGEIVAVVGPSGSGKSTLLRAVAGLEPLAAGRVVVGGRDLAGVPTHRRGVGLMFQDHGLFTHLNVADNVAYGLKVAGVGVRERRRRALDLLDLVGLSGFDGRRVDQLSGGEAQRVALARALAPAPRLLMLDEPLGSLDRALRHQLVGELRRLLTDLGQTALHVTHDQAEAFALADRVAVIERGGLAAIGRPAELWADPGSGFVARFLGHPNIWTVTVDRHRRLRSGDVDLGVLPPGHPLLAMAPGPVEVVVPVDAVRPTAVDGVGLAARVERVVFDRGRHRITARLVGGPVEGEGIGGTEGDGPSTTFHSSRPAAVGDLWRLDVALDGVRPLGRLNPAPDPG